MEDPEYGARIREIFADPETDYEQAYEAIELIKKTDSVERCRALAKTYADKALEELEEIEDSEYRQAMVDLIKFIISRDR